MKAGIFITGLLLLASLEKGSAQAPDWLWTNVMGNASYSDHSNSIAIDGSGNVFATGQFNGDVDFDPSPDTFIITSTGDIDIFVTKFDSSGNFIWAKALGGSFGGGEGLSIAVDASGNLYTTGFFFNSIDFDPGPITYSLSSAFNFDVFISKLTNDGDFIWAKSLRGIGGGDEGRSINIDASGNVYITGDFQGTCDFDPGLDTFNLTASGNSDIFISKFDSSGNFIWAKAMFGSIFARGNSIAVDNQGNVYTTGQYAGTVDFDPGVSVFYLTSNADHDQFISKLDSAGNFIWAKRVGGNGIINNVAGNSIVVDALSNVYTTGTFGGSIDFDPAGGTYNISTSNGSNFAFILKLNGSGYFEWAKTFAGTNADCEGSSIVLDHSNNAYTTGFFSQTIDFDPDSIGIHSLTALGARDMFVTKLDSLGNFIWVNTGGGANNDFGNDIAINSSENIYLVGNFFSSSLSFGTNTLLNTDSTGSNSDFFIAKLDHINTGIIGFKNENDLLIYPNPTSTTFAIRTTIQPQNAQVVIYNVLGEKIYSASYREQLTINCELYPKGIYFVKVLEGRKQRVQKLIIQ